MCLSFLPEQLVRSSQQLALMDTKKGFVGPAITSSKFLCLYCLMIEAHV